MKKKFAAYGLHDSCMVPVFRCSFTNFCISIHSMGVRGSNLAGRVVGVFGSSLMAWSHMVCCGSLWDFSSLNTFLCHLYSFGSLGSSLFLVSFGWIITFPM